MILKAKVYGGQFMFTLPQAYVAIHGIKPGDLFELVRTKDGFLYKPISREDIQNRPKGRGRNAVIKKDLGGDTKL